MAKLDKMTRSMPGFYKPSTNTNIKAVLTAWADEDDRIVEAIKDARDQIFVKDASGQYLNALGSNVGVFRPATPISDELYRALVPILSFRPKQVRHIIKLILDVFFGVNNPAVSINEINPNEIVIQIPSTVPTLARGLRGSLHLKNFSGLIISVDNILKQITISVDGDTKVITTNELALGHFFQDLKDSLIISNTSIVPFSDSGFRSASVTIPLGATSVAVVFSTPMPNANYAVLPQLANILDPAPQFQSPIITQKTLSGFTASWTAPTDSANYLLNFLASLADAPLSSNIVLQFGPAEDLSGYLVGEQYVMSLPEYPGSFLHDPTKPYSVTRNRSTTSQNITAGSIVISLNMQDASPFPDQAGFVIFDFGLRTEEVVEYTRRPSNSTLLLDPTYTFVHDHPIGTVVNFIVKPYIVPGTDGFDYPAYVTGVSAARELAQAIVESVVAAGIVVRWVVPSDIEC